MENYPGAKTGKQRYLCDCLRHAQYARICPAHIETSELSEENHEKSQGLIKSHGL